MVVGDFDFFGDLIAVEAAVLLVREWTTDYLPSEPKIRVTPGPHREWTLRNSEEQEEMKRLIDNNIWL